MKNKKVAIIGTNGIPAKYGGFETLAQYLFEELKDKYDFIVYCSSIYKKQDRIAFKSRVKMYYLPIKANGWQSVLYDILTTVHAFVKADVLLIFGPSAGFILPINSIFKKKIIVNHGGLNEWEREKFSPIAKLLIYINHFIAGKFSQINIADNDPLKKSLANSMGIKSNVIKYGGDHVKIRKNVEKFLNVYPFLKKSYALSISRAQYDNNLHLLLSAYSKMTDERLVLISNWNISDYGKQLYNTYSSYENIILLDAIYEKENLDILRSNASVYIHSHSRCGTAPSLVEAMFYCIPVIVFDVLTNRMTTNNYALTFKNEEELISVIKKELPVVGDDIAQKIYELAKKEYRWSFIAEKYAQIID